MIMTILEKVQEVKSRVALDVGCRDGKYTIKTAPHCGHITAIDINPKAIEKAKSENPGANINFLCMDGRRIGFADDNFDLVYERVTLHHIMEWETALDEMIRVSSRHILIEEPLDDSFDGGKADAGARKFDGFVQPVKSPKQPIGIFHIKADAVIAYEEDFFSFIRCYPGWDMSQSTKFDFGPRAFMSEFPCIAQKIIKHDL